MNLSDYQLQELTSVIQDTVEYASEKDNIPLFTAWTAVGCLSQTELERLSRLSV